MSTVQIQDEGDARLLGSPPNNDESPRVSTPLSFQTFGAQQTSLTPRDGVERPSFDSAQSSSPSTEPPSTPHRQDPYFLSSMSSKVTTETQTADRPTKVHRRFRIHNPADAYRTTPDSPKPTPLSPPPPRTTKQDDVNEPTLRRIAKRRGRPALGVTTYAPSASNIVVEASPLSPVVASPRSTMFQVASQTPSPAPNANFAQAEPAGLPMSPDVTLDLSDSQDLVSPMGTRHITTQAPPAPEKYVQYKPRRRITTPRKRSFVSSPVPDEIFQPIVLDETTQSALRKWSFSGKPESPSASSTLLRRFSKFTLSASGTAGGPTSSKASTDEGHGYGYASEDTGSRRLSIGRRLSHFVTGSRRQSFADARPAPESPDRRKVIMIQSHLSRPQPPLLQTPSTEGSTTLHPSQPSTVTVRSSDGWYSTIPSSLTTQESVLSTVEPTLDLESPEDSTSLRPFKNASSSSVVIPNPPQHVQRATGANVVSQSMPPSPIGPSAASGFPRPASFQPRRFSGNGSTIHDPLGGVPERDGSVRLLDAATAAAIRRSVDFDDRVKRSEDMLRAAIYGPAINASPRSSTVSISRTSMDRGRGGKPYQSSRSQSLDNRHGQHRIRTGSFGNVHSMTTTRDTRGGVFLPSSLEHPDDGIKPPIARANTTSSYATPIMSHSPVPIMKHLPKIDDNHYTTTPVPTYEHPLPLRYRIGNKISRIFTGKPN